MDWEPSRQVKYKDYFNHFCIIFLSILSIKLLYIVCNRNTFLNHTLRALELFYDHLCFYLNSDTVDYQTVYSGGNSEVYVLGVVPHSHIAIVAFSGDDGEILQQV